jgi:hypothetical protein
MSPEMPLSRVMDSRKVGRIAGSECQQLVTSSAYSAGIASSPSGSGGRILSRMTATATAAGLTRARENENHQTTLLTELETHRMMYLRPM